MSDSKHFLTSKIFIGSVIGLTANVATVVLRKNNIDIPISADTQAYLTTIVFFAISGWRLQPTRPLTMGKKK